MGVPTQLTAYGDVKPDTPELVAAKLEERGMTKLGERGEVTPAKVREILALSLAA